MSLHNRLSEDFETRAWTPRPRDGKPRRWLAIGDPQTSFQDGARIRVGRELPRRARAGSEVHGRPGWPGGGSYRVRRGSSADPHAGDRASRLQLLHHAATRARPIAAPLGSMQLAFAGHRGETPVLLTHAGVTASQVIELSVDETPECLAHALNERLRAAVDRARPAWAGGELAALDLEPLHFGGARAAGFSTIERRASCPRRDRTLRAGGRRRAGRPRRAMKPFGPAMAQKTRVLDSKGMSDELRAARD